MFSERTRLAFVVPKPFCAHHRLCTGEALPRQSTAIPLTVAWLARHLNRPHYEHGLISRGAFVVAAAVSRSTARDVGLRKACLMSRQRWGVRIAMTLDFVWRVDRSGSGARAAVTFKLRSCLVAWIRGAGLAGAL